MALIADGCEREGVPLLAMMYGRGDGVRGTDPADVLAHAGSLAADLGADLVKLPLRGQADVMAPVIAQVPLPVLAAGGPPAEGDEFEEFVRQAMAAGAGGIAAGRNIFLADDPKSKAAAVRRAMNAAFLRRKLAVSARPRSNKAGVFA